MTVEAQNHGDFGGKVDNFEDFKIGSVGRYKNAVGVDGNSEFLVLTCGCKEGDRWMVGIGHAVGKFGGGGGPWNQRLYQCLVREAYWSAVNDLLRSKRQISLRQWAFFTFCTGGSKIWVGRGGCRRRQRRGHGDF